MLGLRSAWKEDIQATPAELTFGTTLRLPGEFFVSSKEGPNDGEFIKTFRKIMQNIRSTTSHHNGTSVFVHPELKTCTHVFVRVNAVRQPLQPPYNGPFEVVKRNDKWFKVNINGKSTNISIDRLKPAFKTQTTEEPASQVPAPVQAPAPAPAPAPAQPKPYVTRSGRTVRFHHRMTTVILAGE